MTADRDHAARSAHHACPARREADHVARHGRVAHQHRRPAWGFLCGLLLAFLALLPLPGLATPARADVSQWQKDGPLPHDLAPYPRAILLADGRVLAVAETYTAIRSRDDATWTAIGPRTFNIGAGELLALPDGSALLLGGSPTTFANNPFAPTAQVLRFDPRTAAWKQQRDIPIGGRGDHTLTALPDGTILVAGGAVPGLSPRQGTLTRPEVARYDPTLDAWTPAAPLVQARFSHTATLLPDGRVLVVGGSVSKMVNSENAGSDPLASVEIYSPASNISQLVAPLSRARSGHTATLLHDGTVLIVGGEAGTGPTTAERYDPQTNGWTSAGNLGPQRSFFAATQLLDGTVLVTGGEGTNGKPLAATVTFLPGTNSWQASPAMIAPRARHSAVLVNGTVLVVGGAPTAAGGTVEHRDMTPADTVCYGDTGRCVGGAFLAYWQGHGGLALNGYPLSDPFPERLEDGQVHLVQYFERVRLEAHPAQPAPYDVLLGQFGRRIHPADPPVAPQDGARYVAATGHNIAPRFLAAWEADGGVAQFGYPLTETLTEILEDGKIYTVQYFERARFEYHPENAAPYDILLGQFGRRILAGR